ncbi:iron-containing alcohol dehydrogenase [Streptomyces sp. NPDC052016]|uniref:iron-containing alcohol dehydrogenase n=1 Tax=Streptomyces sp. NPDC052016 TaxID=3365680 RepID=UPI0037CDC947
MAHRCGRAGRGPSRGNCSGCGSTPVGARRGAARCGRWAVPGQAVDLVVSVGEGSRSGLAKAIALTTGVPVVAVPTTYAGSEATSVRGLTEGARKPRAWTTRGCCPAPSCTTRR